MTAVGAVAWFLGWSALLTGLVMFLDRREDRIEQPEPEPEDTDALFAEIWLRQGLRDLATDMLRDAPRGGRHVRN